MNKVHFKNNLIFCFVIFIQITFGQTKKNEPTYKYLKDGDIIFIAKNTEQKKELNFAGIVIIENKIPFVFFADSSIIKCTVNDFISKSYKKIHAVKRILEIELLTTDGIANMKSNTNSRLNIKVENITYLNAINIYNAEFIWKIFQSSIGLAICDKKIVKIELPNQKTENKKIVAINDLFESEQLEYVSE